MRHVYTLFFYLLTPFIVLRLFLKSRKLSAYRDRIPERFGFYTYKSLDKCLWLHAVSYGESVAAEPLINALMKQHPDLPIIVTNMTPTGSERIRKTFKDTVVNVYIPYDIPFAINRFLKHFNPIKAIMMEMELWPNIFHAIDARDIPLLIANARLSEKSMQGYQKIQFLVKDMMKHVTHIAAQTKTDAERFKQIGASDTQIKVTGSIKFDVSIPEKLIQQGKALRDQWGEKKFILIAASTHEGEEKAILSIFKKLKDESLDVKLIIVPRHPERFHDVYDLCMEEGYTVRRRSEYSQEITDIFLGDTMGEMFMFFAAADVAFVGGSLVPIGGHNLLEPLAVGLPTLTGPHNFNSTEITQTLEEKGAIVIANDAASLYKHIHKLIKNPSLRQTMIKQADVVLTENKGSLEKHLGLI